MKTGEDSQNYYQEWPATTSCHPPSTAPDTKKKKSHQD